jgi:hypothetical protein
MEQRESSSGAAFFRSFRDFLQSFGDGSRGIVGCGKYLESFESARVIEPDAICERASGVDGYADFGTKFGMCCARHEQGRLSLRAFSGIAIGNTAGCA